MGLGRMPRLGAVVFVALSLGSALAASAGASPAWKFDGTSLAGKETMVGSASKSTITVFGLTTTCEEIAYEMTIWNSSGTGQAEVDATAFVNCSTSDKACTIESITPEELPWTGKWTTVATTNHLVLAGVEFTILYGGEECALYETPVTVTGTAGARFSQPAQTFAFDAASFSSTSTKLAVFGTTVTWSAVFTTEATGAHKGEPLS